jgi:hypothetical protein
MVAAAEEEEEGAALAPATAGLHWTVLPPMPQPRRGQMRSEASCGCVTVLGVIAACVGGTYLFVSVVGSWEFPHIFHYIIGVEAAVAIICLLGLLLGDPGTLKRSEARCTPIPEGTIRDFLLQGKPVPTTVGNFRDPARGTYCVRCLLWREKAEREVHHCRICQRCVVDFDHHCGVFGRCIAGRGLHGNMGYFKGVIAMGCLGTFTTMGAFMAGVSSI